MLPFRQILVAADFSEGSRSAFRVACALARADESRISVLHVLEPPQVAEGPVYLGQQTVQFSPGKRDPRDEEADRERLRRFYVPDRPIEAEYRTRDGQPEDVILREAEETRCDLIVMGTHGRTGLFRLLTGSVAEAILRRAPCSVLAVRSPDSAEAPAGGIRAILAATDFSENSGEALRVARALARDLGARLVLIYVDTMEVIPAEVPMIMNLEDSRDSLEAMRKILDGPDLKSPVEAVLGQGEVDSEILNAAEAKGCDLIVMGTHGRTGLFRLLLGSAAEAVLRRSSRPVLMVKPQAPASGASPGAGGAATPQGQSLAGLQRFSQFD